MTFELDLRYAYLIGTLLFGLVWLYFFSARKDSRKEMCTVGFFVGIAAIFWAPWFLHDYWHPVYAWFFGLEDFLYGFFGGGIVSAAYTTYCKRRLSMRRISARPWKRIFLVTALASISIFLLLWQLHINAIYSAFGMYAFFLTILFVQRPDLLRNAFMSGVLFTAITFIFFQTYLLLYPDIVTTWWHLENLVLPTFFGIPVEELVWAFFMGMTGGPLYEFFSGKKTVALSKNSC